VLELWITVLTTYGTNFDAEAMKYVQDGLHYANIMSVYRPTQPSVPSLWIGKREEEKGREKGKETRRGRRGGRGWKGGGER